MYGWLQMNIMSAATTLSSETLITPLLTGSGKASTAYRNPSFVVCVVTATPPPRRAATNTKAGSPCQAVAAASAAAAGGRIRECSVSHADASAGMSEAKNSTAVSVNAMPITHQEVTPARLPGSWPIHPIRAARPTMPTVAYRLRPAAYATPAACASVCSAFTRSSVPRWDRSWSTVSIDEAERHHETEVG